MSEPRIELEIQRYRPESDEAPVWQSYQVPYREDLCVLDALNYIKDHLDGTLSYRWSCHMAICGSCGMVINGDPLLACKAFLRDYYPRKVTVEPLANFPIERDLVVVMDAFLEKLSSIKPYIIPGEGGPEPDQPSRQTPAQLDRYQQYAMCINCLLCYSACPQSGLSEDFIGPAALALAHRYNLDSRDEGRSQRQEIAASNEGIWECTFVGACSDVCPKHVDPAAAIQQTKIASSIDWMQGFLMPWRKQ